MGVSINGGTPKSSILMGCPLSTNQLLGYPHDYGNHLMISAKIRGEDLETVMKMVME